MNKIWVKIRSRFRKLTSSYRVLPEVIIIGAQKSGTTSLFEYLKNHPRLSASYKKEVHFFDGGLNPKVDDFNKGIKWYKTHFPLKFINNKKIAYEASPLYIFNPLVPERIYNQIPKAKLIVVLRNPVERAISHYFHEKRQGRETLQITGAMKQEEQRLEEVIKIKDYKSNAFIHASYKSRGIYHEQLNRYYALFPKENLLVLNSDELFKQPLETLKTVYEFLGIEDYSDSANLKPQNIGSNRSKVDNSVYQLLETYFAEHNEKLFQLIGKRFDW